MILFSLIQSVFSVCIAVDVPVGMDVCIKVGLMFVKMVGSRVGKEGESESTTYVGAIMESSNVGRNVGFRDRKSVV